MNLQPNYNKEGLIPAIIQDVDSRSVLMLGYMNAEALRKTYNSQYVTFYSRSKQRLWTKGETSGHYFIWKDIQLDCDKDTLLISVKPQGPACHLGTETCWGTQNKNSLAFLETLEGVIKERRASQTVSNSYVASLFAKGRNKIAQKVGEEAVEVVIASKDDNDVLFLNESADLMFHYLLLLEDKGFGLKDVVGVLKSRH